MKAIILITSIGLLISLYLNVNQFIDLEIKDIELSIAHEESEATNVQRQLILKLIPKLKPNVSINELESIIKKEYPNETTNIIGNSLQWRLFRFDYNENRLSKVWYGS